MSDRISCEEIHDRQALLKGRADGALGRLLEVRARLMRASAQVINSPFRDELIRYIDTGRWNG